MTPLDAAGAFTALDLVGTGLAVAGSIAGSIALYKFFTTLGKARKYRKHVREEQSHNTKSLRGTLRGCRKTMARVRGIEDEESYFRSLGALAVTLEGAMSRYEAHIDHNARKSVQILSLLLLDAATVGRQESDEMLKAASAHIGKLLMGARPPPVDPRPDG